MESTDKYKTLVFVTDAFPFVNSGEYKSVMAEIEELSKAFERVVIMPTVAEVAMLNIPFPENVEVSRFFIDYPARKSRIRRLRLLLDREVWHNAGGFFNYSSVSCSIAAEVFAEAVRKWMKQNDPGRDTTLFYSSKFDFAAAGLALISREQGVNYVMRVRLHDVDVNMSRGLRQLTMEKSKRVFADCNACVEHIKSLYPESAAKIVKQTIGSTKGAVTDLASGHRAEERKLTFLSVSQLTGCQRVELNFNLLRALAVARPATAVRWIHTGGSESAGLTDIFNAGCPANLSVELKGALSDEAIHELYVTEPIDWFMSLSGRAGLPIAVCEALSYGVPVIATDVAGINEAIDDDCGLLLDKNPAIEEFVRGIVPYIDSDYRMRKLRSGAFKCWQDNFDALKLCREFVGKIRLLEPVS